jgi:hypothetical protein
MGEACSTYGGDEKCKQNSSQKMWMEETTWETQSQMEGQLYNGT